MRMAPVFQLYRTVEDDVVWWRMISPNGRGIAKNAVSFSSIDGARESINRLVRSIDSLTSSMRVTDAYRWRWILSVQGEALAQSATDLDRRVRCEQAWRKFVLLAPLAEIAPTIQHFGPGGNGTRATGADLSVGSIGRLREHRRGVLDGSGTRRAELEPRRCPS